MAKETRKCRECGTQHYYRKEDGTPSETCQNCTWLLTAFWVCVKALNEGVPPTGRPRRITITQYKIEKV